MVHLASPLSIPELVPANFRCGVKVLNDNSTPTEFVVEILQTQLKLAYAEATAAMLDIHKRGGRLFPTVNPPMHCESPRRAEGPFMPRLR